MDTRTSWPALIGALIRSETLTAEETAWAMNEIMDGAATPSQIAGFAVALRMKGETVGEVSGLAEAMLEHATPISVPGPIVDLVGHRRRRRSHREHLHHGHDHRGRGRRPDGQARQPGGVVGVRHGRRAGGAGRRHRPAAGRYRAAGGRGRGRVPVRRALPPGVTGYASVPRRELGVPTVFNFLGPLTNPARPGALAVGVAHAPDGARCWPGCWPGAATRPWSSTATTGWTS